MRRSTARAKGECSRGCGRPAVQGSSCVEHAAEREWERSKIESVALPDFVSWYVEAMSGGKCAWCGREGVGTLVMNRNQTSGFALICPACSAIEGRLTELGIERVKEVLIGMETKCAVVVSAYVSVKKLVLKAPGDVPSGPPNAPVVR